MPADPKTCVHVHLFLIGILVLNEADVQLKLVCRNSNLRTSWIRGERHHPHRLLISINSNIEVTKEEEVVVVVEVGSMEDNMAEGEEVQTTKETEIILDSGCQLRPYMDPLFTCLVMDHLQCYLTRATCLVHPIFHHHPTRIKHQIMQMDLTGLMDNLIHLQDLHHYQSPVDSDHLAIMVEAEAAGEVIGDHCLTKV